MQYADKLNQTIFPGTESSINRDVARFISRTYGWMFLGLIATALTSFLVASSEAAVHLFLGNQFLFFGLIIGELALVFALSAGINRISAASATLMFFLYSILNGITFSVIFLAYSLPSIGNIFLLTAGMFGGLAFFGTVTKKNLSGLGTFFIMGLWGVILASLIKLFIRSESLNFSLAAISILIFSGLTAYDSQRIKNLATEHGSGLGEDNGAIIGALMLYLDFINLFLSLLRIFGRRRD